MLLPPNDEALLDRIGEVRRTLAVETGIVLPGVRLRDDLTREPDGYAIRLHDAVVAAGRLQPGRLLAVGESAARDIGGEPVREPVYGLEARALPVEERERAAAAGLLTFDPISILGSHLAEAARSNAADLFGRQDMAALLEHLRAVAPALVKEIGESNLPLAVVHGAFVLLLREKMWPRDPVVALEAVADAAHLRDPRGLAEAARRRLVPLELRRRNELLNALVASPELEDALAGVEDSELGVAPDPKLATALRDRLAEHAQRFARNAAVITSARVRPLLAALGVRWGLAREIFSSAEFPREMPLHPAAVLHA